MSEFFSVDNGWKIVMHKAAEGGYWGEVPAMPGCVSEGDTEAETRANVIEAAHGCLDAYLSMAIVHSQPHPSLHPQNYQFSLEAKNALALI